MMHSVDIVVMSYDILRNDIDEISAVQSTWNYCVLDEGHIIKNKKAQITKVCSEKIAQYPYFYRQ